MRQVRRALLVAASAWLASTAARSFGQGIQPTGKVYRIGSLGSDQPDAVAWPYQKAIFDSLRQYGYESGKNLVVEMRYARHDLSRLPELARELVALNPDVLITAGTPAAKA